jgi:hypothetical protein
MWALGQYSAFIKPGMKRVEINTRGNKTHANGNEDVLVSAYKTPNNKKLVVVIINLSKGNKKLSFDYSFTPFKKARMFRTSKNPKENILPIGFYKPSDIFPITGRSITTIEFND